MHSIQGLYLHVELGGTESEGFVLQQQLSEISRTQLLTALAQTLDRCGMPDEVYLCIDRLELNVGNLELRDLENKLPAAVARFLEKKIKQEIAAERKNRLGEQADADFQKDKLSRATEALLYFLRRGHLPWFWHLAANSEFEAQLAANLDGAQLPIPQRDALIELLRVSLSARQRLLWQFSDGFRERLLRLISPVSVSVLQALRENMNALTLSESLRKATIDELWSAAFFYAGQRAAPIQWIQKTAQALRQSLSAREYTSWQHEVSHIWPEIGKSRERATDGDEALHQHSDDKADIYIENAGLVLLHPFLPSLFESQLLALPTGHLAQPEQALLLLHYLATGRGRAEEHELVLPKILCGMAPDAPVDLRLAISDTEKTEADKLLLGVIGYWEALRGTTPDGLRGNFLCREGRLSPRDGDSWRLLVERKTHDVLLGQLPWGIGMIKLPWMNGMLWVEWN